ncbi:hypothetical protein QBC39DRAFT_421813 [Podospora conica]|nr:hypothetical protein QBC39DRAFT_421813 [Schizothecium conicum]
MDRPPLQRQGSRVRFAEGQEFVPSPPPPPSSTTATATSATNHAGAPSPPGVYWDDLDLDRDSTATGGAAKTEASSSANYTFYREGTPPPHAESSDDYEKLVLKHRDREREREREHNSRHHHPRDIRDVGGPGYPSVLSPVPIRPASAFPPYEVTKFDPNDPGPESDEGSLGREQREREQREAAAAKRKKYRWLFFVVALLFIAIPIGVGTGVALGLKKSDGSGSGSSAPATSPSALPETTSLETPIPTTTTSSPVVVSTEPPRFVPGLVACPAANNTLYLVPGSTKVFLRYCGIDYDGTDGAYDLTHIYTTSMEQCMTACASSDLCTGCGWGRIDGDSKGNYRCWMKNNLQTPHKAREDYCFALLQD